MVSKHILAAAKAAAAGSRHEPARQFLAVIRDELLSHLAMAAVGALVALAVVAVVS